MKLPKLPLGNKKENPEYFLTLLLRNEKAQAVVFAEQSGKMHVVGSHEAAFSDSIDHIPFEELLKTLDNVISTAETSLPPDVQTQKTVFGVKESWVEEGKIKKEHLAKLKKICDELGLAPIGFLTVAESIMHLLQEEEGAPVSGLLAEIGKKYLTVSLLKNGRVLETKTAPMKDSVVETTDALLRHFSSFEILPSRIIIFGGTGDLTQDFISHTWSKTIPFLHLPQIGRLPDGFAQKAMLAGASSQMGFELANSTPAVVQDQFEETPADEKESDEKTIEEEITRENEGDEEQNNAEFFGFVKDKDIASVPTMQPAKSHETDEHIDEEIAEIPNEIKEEKTGHASFPALTGTLFAGMGKVLKGIAGQTKFLKNIPVVGGNKKLLLLPVIAIILIAFILFGLLGTRATVTLGLSAKTLSKDQAVTFSTSSATNPADDIMTAQTVTTTEDSTATVNTTGKKAVGTPAKGTVTIFNSNSSSVTLSKGAVITSANGLKFTIDQDVTVASGSADPLNLQAGTTNASVTAADIGTEYNLPSQTKFSTSNSSVAAKNDNAFSGGTKKDVTVVSKADLQTLQTNLAQSLEQKAKDDSQKQISQDQEPLPGFVATTVKNPDYDKKAGDEASQVTIKGSVDFVSLAYNKKDMQNFGVSLLSPDANGMKLDPNNITVDASDVKQKNDKTTTATLKISAKLYPVIDEKQLAGQISGKSVSQAKNMLSNMPQVNTVTISFSPPLPIITGSLPRIPDHIKIVLQNE